MAKCKGCKEANALAAGAIVGLCFRCCAVLEEEAERRGYNLLAPPAPGEAASRIVLSTRLVYWRERWRVG